MIKVITAIGKPVINEKLCKLKNIEVIGKDIQYAEAILEIIKKIDKIDYIIMDENLPSELDKIELIKEIKKFNINQNILNVNLKEELLRYKKKKLKNLYRDFDEYIISIILKEMHLLYENKKIKNEKYFKNKKKNKVLINFFITLRRLKRKCKQSNYNEEKKKDKKIFLFIGNVGVGKSITIINLSHILIKKNKKVLIISNNAMEYFKIKKMYRKNEKKFIKVKNNLYFYKQNDNICYDKDFEKYDYIFLELSENNERNYITNIIKIINKIYLIVEPNLIGIKRANNLLNNYKEIINKENKNLEIIINKKNKFSIDKNLIKKIFLNYKIIGEINNEDLNNLYINKKYKNIIINKKIKNQYKKIFMKIK